jgi:hypothetical protein
MPFVLEQVKRCYNGQRERYESAMDNPRATFSGVKIAVFLTVAISKE